MYYAFDSVDTISLYCFLPQWFLSRLPRTSQMNLFWQNHFFPSFLFRSQKTISKQQHLRSLSLSFCQCALCVCLFSFSTHFSHYFLPVFIPSFLIFSLCFAVECWMWKCELNRLFPFLLYCSLLLSFSTLWMMRTWWECVLSVLRSSFLASEWFVFIRIYIHTVVRSTVHWELRVCTLYSLQATISNYNITKWLL